jgi:two-component system, chemotaxis family, chemotaxis protein CheY
MEISNQEPQAGGAKKSILIVDDAKFMRNKLRSILEGAGFFIIGEAEDGRQAVQEYTKLKPDVTTMDITMPEVDGITSLKAIKKIDPKAKVVMISALGQKEKVRDSIFAGALDFIIKPFSPEKIVEIITRISEKQI